jgi:hypothetical protein
MIKQLPLVIVLTLFLTSLAYAQESTPSPSPSPKPAMSKAQSQRVIIATEKKLWEAFKNNDNKPFKAYLANDSVMISDTGVTTKAAVVKDIGSGGCDVKSYELSDIKVAFINSSTAIMTYKSTQDGTCGGQTLPPAAWSSSVYIMRGGKWLAVSHQETVAK